MNNRQRSGDKRQRSREIGLVKRQTNEEEVVQRQIAVQLERLRRQQENQSFLALKQTLLVAQNRDPVWQENRKFAMQLVERIKEKRNLLAQYMLQSNSLEVKLELNNYLSDQQYRLLSKEEEMNKLYLFNAHIPHILTA